MLEMGIIILMVQAFLGPLVYGVLMSPPNGIAGLLGAGLFFILTFPPALAAGVFNAGFVWLITAATSFFHRPYRPVRCAVLGFISGGVSGYAATILITLRLGSLVDERARLLSIGVASGFICGAIAVPWSIKRRASMDRGRRSPG